MKRIFLVSTMLVFVALSAACSESANQTDPSGETSLIETAEASQKKDETFVMEGSGEIDVDTDDTGKQNSTSIEQSDGVIEDEKYINKELGFSFDIPEHWVEHLVIESGYWEEETDHSIDFYYVVDGDVKEFLFSILVYDRVIEESEWQNELWTYVGTANGKTYSHVITGEPSEAILEEKNKDHFEFVQILINEELLDALSTFEYMDI